MDRRKELIAKYKETKIPMGVYQIKNNANNKVFIGSNLNIQAIFNRTKMELNYGTFRIKEIQKDWNEYGEDKFDFDVLEILEPLDEPGYKPNDDLKALEEIWLERVQPFDEKGYNMRKRVK